MRTRNILPPLFALLLLLHLPLFHTQDPCAPGIPRSPDLLCPDTPLGAGAAVGSTGGIVATTTYSSCAFFQDESGQSLDCGPDGQGATMTVLDLSLTPGSGQSVVYTFNLARSAPAAGGSAEVNPGSGGGCSGEQGGTCWITSTQTVQVEITVSDSVVMYQMADTGLTTPYAATAFHSNNFGDGTKPTQGCGSASSVGGFAPYQQTGQKTRPQGVVGWAGIVSPPMRPHSPYTGGIGSIPYSWDMSSEEQLFGSSCHQPLKSEDNYNAFNDGVFACVPDANGFQCQALDPNPFAAAYCSVDPKEDSTLRTIPPSPFSTPNVFVSGAVDQPPLNPNCRPFTDLFPYGGVGSTALRWQMCTTKYNDGRLSNISPQLLWSGHYFYSGLVRNGDYYYQWSSGDPFGQRQITDNPDTYYLGDVRPVIIGCGYDQWFPSTNCLQPVPAKAGGLFEPGKDPWPYVGSRRPGEITTCSVDDDDCVGSATTIIPEDKQSQPSSTPTSLAQSSVPLALCSAQVPPSPSNSPVTWTHALNVFLQALIPGAGGLIFPSSPQPITVNGQTYCSPDRVGIWEGIGWFMPDWLATAYTIPFVGSFSAAVYYSAQAVRFLGNALGGIERDQYQTADTFGTIGEPCRLYNIRPAAIPVYAVHAVLRDVKTQVILEEIQLTNLPSLGIISTPAAGPGTSQTVNLNTNEPDAGPSSIIGEGRLMYLSFTGYQTVNGKIAPDLLGAIAVCNLTADSIGLYQSDTDPQFGTPRNPWVYSNNEDCGRPGTNSNPRCDFMDPAWCASSGKVPLPQCLAARAPAENVTYNPYAWWYYIPPEKLHTIGEGCGQLAFSSARMAEPGVAQLVCQSSRYRCVPGWPEGFDWTMEQRLTDQLNTTQQVRSITGQVYVGSNAQEKALRDALSVHTPCVVSGYLNEWRQQSTCADFLKSVGYQNYLPTNFAVYAGADQPCALPTYSVDGTNLLYFGQAQSSTQATVRFQLGIAGTLTRVEASVSSGVFDRTVPPACGVQLGGDGVAQFTVRNTGGLPGQYLIRSTCSNGVRQVGDAVVQVPAEGSTFVQVRLQQSPVVVGLQQAICSFNLTHPDFQSIVLFDQLQEVQCSLLLLQQVNGTITGIPGGNVSACIGNGTELDPKCIMPDIYAGQKQESNTIIGIVLYVLWLIFVGVGVLFITMAIRMMT